VHGVFVASDFVAMGGLPCLAPVKNADGSLTPLKPYPVMADGVVQHVGDIVAMVVADTPWRARDAAEAVAVDWEARPAVPDVESAIEDGAAQVYSGAPGNVAYDREIGDRAKTEAAFARAPHVVRVKVVNPRAVANFLETRVAEYDSTSDRLTPRVRRANSDAFAAACEKSPRITSNMASCESEGNGHGGPRRRWRRQRPPERRLAGLAPSTLRPERPPFIKC
jgi:CO/xanthine dehydrogenase Mo-binding subunit